MATPMYDNQLLITRDDIQRECRPTSADEALVDRCIEEAQMLDIIPAIGADWWVRLLSHEDDAVVQLLWNGGLYQDSDGCNHIFGGLKKSLTYYAYGRLLRAQIGVSTRFGFQVKTDQYSDSAELKAQVQAYNEAFSTADGYKAQCLVFINDSGCCNPRKVVNNRLQVKKIGF